MHDIYNRTSKISQKNCVSMKVLNLKLEIELITVKKNAILSALSVQFP